MPGTPRSTGCVNCHRKKKKCDESKPSCGSCRRLGVRCVGNGTKRWKFIHEPGHERPIVHPQTVVPTNETTTLVAGLVHILKIHDVRYDIRAFGDEVMSALPSRVGACPELDTTISAVVALYSFRQYGKPKPDALAAYGKALRATRRAIGNHAEAPTMAIQTMMMASICQTLIDRKNVQQHRVVMLRLFQNAVLHNPAFKLDHPQVFELLKIAAWTSLVEPGFRLDSWFWETYKVFSCTQPQACQSGAFFSLEMSTVASISMHIHSQLPDIANLRRIYDFIQVEKPQIRQMIASVPGAEPECTESMGDQCQALSVSGVFSWAMILALESIVNRTLRNFDADPRLLIAAKDTYFEALELAKNSNALRPFGSGFLPEKLKVVWASTADILDTTEMTHMLLDYETDIEGADFLCDAERLRQLLKSSSKRQKEAMWK